MALEAVILAGGLGTRLKREVPLLPKPMAPVLGRPFLAHLMDHWAGQGVGRFILSTGYLADVIEDYFGTAYQGIAVEYSRERIPLGTGGAARLAAALVRSESFLLLNGDTHFGIPAARLLTVHAEKKAKVTLAVKRIAENDRYDGVEIAPDGKIRGFGTPASHLVNGGVYCVDRNAFTCTDDTSFSLEKDFLPKQLREGTPLYAEEFAAPFIDIGVPESYRAAGGFFGGEK